MPRVCATFARHVFCLFVGAFRIEILAVLVASAECRLDSAWSVAGMKRRPSGGGQNKLKFHKKDADLPDWARTVQTW